MRERLFELCLRIFQRARRAEPLSMVLCAFRLLRGDARLEPPILRREALDALRREVQPSLGFRKTPLRIELRF